MLQHRGGHTRLLHRDHGQSRITGRCQKLLDLVNMAGDMDNFIFAALNIDVPSGKALHVRVHGGHNRLTVHGEHGGDLSEPLRCRRHVIDDEAGHNAVEGEGLEWEGSCRCLYEADVCSWTEVMFRACKHLPG